MGQGGKRGEGRECGQCSMFCIRCNRTDWADSYPVHNLLAYSAHPLLINPTHFAGDPEWFSDTEPPMEILEQIRQKKVRDEAKFMEEEERREKIKQEARQRQIQAMKDKLKPKVEL